MIPGKLEMEYIEDSERMCTICRLIDWLLFIVQRTLFQLYQDENKFNNT